MANTDEIRTEEIEVTEINETEDAGSDFGAKDVGVLVLIAAGGYGVLRLTEAGVKKAWPKVKEVGHNVKAAFSKGNKSEAPEVAVEHEGSEKKVIETAEETAKPVESKGKSTKK